MPRRLGVALTFAAIFGSSGLVRAQSSASFPDPDAPSEPATSRRPQAPPAESPPRREVPRPAPPPEPSSPPATPSPAPRTSPTPTPSKPPQPAPPSPASEDAPAPLPAVVAAPREPAALTETPSSSLGSTASTRLDLLDLVAAPGPAPGPLGTFRPPVLPAYAGMEPPDGYHAESSSNRGLVWGGALTWGIGYAAALGYGMSDAFDGKAGTLAIPVLGPWLAMGQQSFDCDTPDSVESARSCQDESFGTAKTLAVLGTVGLVQAVGGTLFLVGLFDRREHWVRDDLGIAELRLDAMPLAGGGGAWVQGRF